MYGWKKNIRQVTPYVPGEQPREGNIIKLNTNENPYPPSGKVLEAIKGVDGEQMRKYPDPDALSLAKALAGYHGVSSSNVFVGVGSDDVIGMSFLTFFNGGEKVLFPDITYSFYDVWAGLFKVPYMTPELDGDLRICCSDYINVKNGGIIFPNPNAPTGLDMDMRDMEEIIKSNPSSVVIVDEAYVDFGGVSMIPLTKKYDNLLITRTYSKSRSMAGMRIGYAIGDKELIDTLKAVKNSYNSYTLSSVAIKAAIASLEDDEYFKKCVKKITDTRERSKTELKKLGFSFPDSKANFIFAKHEKVPAGEIFQRLKENKILVRYFDREKINGHLRITVGTDEEMDSLFSCLGRIL